MMHFNSLKKLAALAALALLAACGGGGGSDSEGNGGSGGNGSLPLGIALTMGPHDIIWTRDQSVTPDVHVLQGAEVPASIFTVINQDGSTRLATMSDLYFFEGSDVTKTATGFVINSSGIVSVIPSVNSRDSWLGGQFTIQPYTAESYEQKFDGERYRFFSAFNKYEVKVSETDSFRVKAVDLQRNATWDKFAEKDAFTNLAMPLGSTLTLKHTSENAAPASIRSGDGSINWAIGDPAPVLNTEGEFELTISPQLGTPVTFKLTVYGELETLRLDAGFSAGIEGQAPVLVPQVYNPYKVVGKTKSGKELDLSALYDSTNAKFELTGSSLFVEETSGSVFTVQLSDRVERDDNIPLTVAEMLGLPETELSLDVDVRKMDRASAGKTYYFTGVNQAIPEIEIDGFLNGKRFELKTHNKFLGHSGLEGEDNSEAVVNYQDGKTIGKGRIGTTISLNTYSNAVLSDQEASVTMVLEVGDELANEHDHLKGFWQYLDTEGNAEEKRFIGSHIADTYTVESNDLIKLSNNRYLVRAGISDVDVTAKAEVIGGTPISGRSSLDQVSARKLSTRSIGGGNVIFKNVETGDETTVEPNEKGEIDVELPTGEYTVSSEVEVDGVLAIFTAPAVVEGAAIDLGTFTAVTPDIHNFKTQLIANEYLFFGSDDGSVEYGSKALSSKVKIKITNTTGSSVSGLRIFVTEDTTGDLFHEFDHQNVFGGLNEGESKELGITFKLKKPQENTQARINIRIEDGDNRVWNDYVVFDVSNADPMTLEVAASTGEGLGGKANGYIVAPGNKLIKLAINGTGSKTFTIGDANPDGKYRLILSNTEASDEAAYGIGVGLSGSLDRTALDNYNEDIYKGEDSDDDPSTPTSLEIGEEYRSYLLENDVDYYQINVPVLQ